jgi:recombination protein RecA
MATKLDVNKAEFNKADENKKKAVESAIQAIEKAFGKGSIMSMSSAGDSIKRFSSGSMSIDKALGGGFPSGRIIEIYGHESSGKTTLAIHAIAEIQKTGGKCAFIDAEHAFDPVYAKNLGVSIDDLLVSQPDYGEQALEIVDYLVRSGGVDLIVVDSVAALVPKEEIEGEMEKQQMGLQARLMSKALRKLTGNASRLSCTIIFINQLRQKISQGYGGGYGPQETTTGGNALKFYASVRVEVRKVQTLKKGEEETGTMTRFKVVKNKVAPPFKSAILEIVFGEGLSRESEVIDLGVKFNVIEKAGSWYSYNGERLGQGKDNLREKLKKDRSMFEKIEKIVRGKLMESNDDQIVGPSEVEEIDE